MDAKFLKIVMLAAVADGEIQAEELDMLNQIKKAHPELKDIPDEAARASMADIYNKFSAGMGINLYVSMPPDGKFSPWQGNLCRRQRPSSQPVWRPWCQQRRSGCRQSRLETARHSGRVGPRGVD